MKPTPASPAKNSSPSSSTTVSPLPPSTPSAPTPTKKHLATHSLTDLEQLYATILNPALSYLQMQPLCPPWPSGRQIGRLPSLETLRTIKHRLMAEQTINDLVQTEGFLKTLRHHSTVQSVALQTELFNAIIALLGEELLAAKLDGKPITENLRGVDRLIKVAALRLRQQQGEARQKLQERREDRLDRRQSGNQCDTNQEDQDEYVEDDSGLTEDEKSRNLIRKNLRSNAASDRTRTRQRTISTRAHSDTSGGTSSTSPQFHPHTTATRAHSAPKPHRPSRGVPAHTRPEASHAKGTE